MKKLITWLFGDRWNIDTTNLRVGGKLWHGRCGWMTVTKVRRGYVLVKGEKP